MKTINTTADTFEDMDNHNRINALETLLPMVNKHIKKLNLDSMDEQKLKLAFLNVLFYMGTQEQYYEFKDNY